MPRAKQAGSGEQRVVKNLPRSKKPALAASPTQRFDRSSRPQPRSWSCQSEAQGERRPAPRTNSSFALFPFTHVRVSKGCPFEDHGALIPTCEHSHRVREHILIPACLTAHPVRFGGGKLVPAYFHHTTRHLKDSQSQHLASSHTFQDGAGVRILTPLVITEHSLNTHSHRRISINFHQPHFGPLGSRNPRPARLAPATQHFVSSQSPFGILSSVKGGRLSRPLH